MTKEEAIKYLETYGLIVHPCGDNAFQIAKSYEKTGDINVSDNAVILIPKDDAWLLIVPGPGACTYEVVNTLARLIPLVHKIYRAMEIFRKPIREAFRFSIEEPDLYLVGKINVS